RLIERVDVDGAGGGVTGRTGGARGEKNRQRAGAAKEIQRSVPEGIDHSPFSRSRGATRAEARAESIARCGREHKTSAHRFATKFQGGRRPFEPCFRGGWGGS